MLVDVVCICGVMEVEVGGYGRGCEIVLIGSVSVVFGWLVIVVDSVFVFLCCGV